MDLLFAPYCFLANSGGIGFAFEQSNIAGKTIIFLLIIASIFSWPVMWTKFQMIRHTQKDTLAFLKKYRSSKNPLSLFAGKARFTFSAAASVYRAGASELCFHLLGSSEIDETFEVRLANAKPLDNTSMAAIRSSMEQAVSEEALKLESQLILLATVVSGAPFLGLLGTVWGVMDAFSGVALAGNPSLTALAPGVSGALLTTVTGLLVAIPAMFGYNFLITTIREIIVQTENFAAECASDFEHKYLKKRD